MNVQQSIGNLLMSRRFSVSVLAILALTAIALVNKIDTSLAIASVAAAVSASNSYQKRPSPNTPINTPASAE